ncbi:hypothetical protein [Maritimibacter sp. DP1N21-5]|uniref:hypothetical protein n=1 Tax=Maritimibacter sp. DP1N21-5 TaxID=2836867 RepID=UPI001C46CA00|nr:hypothetical protein [Maritimibacter sp. DP1N21-5]MBV7408681.1 hypothetical protein [Maritimibacter sp. DP1N21-5]
MKDMRNWQDLTEEERTALQVAYQPALDSQPSTCDFDLKVARFADWLARHNIAFTREDISRK